MSATNEWNRTSLASSQGPPGYPSAIGGSVGTGAKQSMASTTPADSVLELKRGLKDQQQNNSSPLTTSTSDDESSRGSSSGDMGSTNREEDVNHEYQTMDRITYEQTQATSSTFRPPNQSTTSNNSNSTPRSSINNSGRQLPQVPSIPS